MQEYLRARGPERERERERELELTKATKCGHDSSYLTSTLPESNIFSHASILVAHPRRQASARIQSNGRSPGHRCQIHEIARTTDETRSCKPTRLDLERRKPLVLVVGFEITRAKETH